jgi:hypothetical protein
MCKTKQYRSRCQSCRMIARCVDNRCKTCFNLYVRQHLPPTAQAALPEPIDLVTFAPTDVLLSAIVADHTYATQGPEL